MRTATIHNAEGSLAFLERALSVAQDLVAAEKSMTKTSVVDIRRGALSQIVEENTPSGLHKIVPDIVERIDAIVVEVV